MAKKLIRDVSASTAQVLLNQFFGLAIFYLLSRFLTKEVFGELNWSIALISTFIIFIGLGLEQIVLKRVAIKKNNLLAARVFILHTLMTSVFFLGVLALLSMIATPFFEKHFLFLGIALASAITYISSPFKQIASGNEKFSYLAIMSVTGNITKTLLICLLLYFSKLSVNDLILVFILSSLIELLICVLLVRWRLKHPIIPAWSKSEFKSLAKESFPQLGVLIFDSALARIDWIILGIISGAVATAEYSFAYKIFEISRLPMLVIAPVILPKLSRYFLHDQLGDERKEQLRLLLKVEAIIAVIIPIILNLAWVPLIGQLTDYKYGAVNELVYLILSFSVPLHYLTNFLWTIAFSQQQIRLTLLITVFVSIVNIVMNVVLIPEMGSEGAAIAFTTSTLIQVILYKKYVNQQLFKVNIRDFIICMAVSFLIIMLLRQVNISFYIKSILGLAAYLFMIVVLRVLKWEEIKKFQILFAR